MAARGGDTIKRVTYDSFTFGDHGVVASLRAPRRSYSGMDAVVYADGNIGPRCGIAEITGSGIPAGVLAGVGFYSLAGSTVPDAWFAVGTAVYRNPSAPVALTGSLASAPTAPLGAQPVGNRVYITSAGDKTYEITSSAVSAVASSPGGTIIALYGERLVVAGDPANPNRVYYTDALPDAGTPATFPALGYFQVGRGATIVGLWVIRNLIYIALDDGTWWVYSGVPGVSDSLRLAYTGQSAPAGPQAGAVIGANAVWFVARGEHFPSYFNGSSVATFDDQDTLGKLYGPTDDDLYPAVTVIPISRRGDLLCLAGAGLTGENRVSLLMREERWSRHSLFPPVAVPMPGGGGLVLMSDGGGPSASARFFVWQATGFDRPPDGVETRPVVDPGIGTVEATISIPEYVPESGAELRVRSVTVDVRVYDKEPPPSLLRLPGQSGNYASTPDAGVLDITGDLDVRIQVGPDSWTSTGAQGLIGKWVASGNQRSWRLSLTTAGALELEWSTDGTAVTTKTSTADLSALAGGTVRWVRATLDVDNGAAGNDVKFYTSTDGPNWSQLGATVTTAGVTSIFSSTSPVEIGSTDAGTGRLLVGNVYSATVKSGIDGSTVTDPDFTVQTAGAVTFTDGSSRAWTVNQAGTLQADIRSDATPAELRPVNGLEIGVFGTRMRGEVQGEVQATPQTKPVRAEFGTSDGLPLRIKRHFGDQGVSGGFRVELNRVRGVAVEQVHVEFAELAGTP